MTSPVSSSSVDSDLVSGSLHPSPEQIQRFMNEFPRDSPIQMLNLVRYRTKANYPPSHPQSKSNLTGAEAYQLYFQEMVKLFESLGGKLVYQGSPEMVLIGPSNEHWDQIFVGEYPSAKSFLQFTQHPEYQKLAQHRTAAVADFRLIRLKPSTTLGTKTGTGTGTATAFDPPAILYPNSSSL